MNKAYLNLLDNLSDMACVIDLEGSVKWLNATAIKTLVSEERPLLNTFFSTLLEEEDSKHFTDLLEKAKENDASQKFSVTHYLSENNSIELNWNFVFDTDQNVIYGTAKNPLDNEARVQIHYLDQLERSIMEQTVDPSASLRTILNNYMKGLEDIFPALKASILKIKDNKVWHVASHSLPKEFTTTINDQPIGSKAGSCGTAAYTKKRVIVSDISTDPLWEEYKSLALPLNLKACWSQPIFNAKKEVVATFANYYGSIRTPSEKELKVFERSASLVSIIFEHFQKKSELESKSELFSYVNLATNDAIYDWNILEDHIKWGESFSRLFGYALSNKKYPLSKWESLVHPKDLKGSLLSLQTCLDDPSRSRWNAKYRFKKADGDYAHIEEKGYIIRDDKGEPIRMIGVVSDVYETWLAEQKKEALKIFSHIFNKSVSLQTTLEEFNQTPISQTIFSISEVWLTNTNKNEISCFAIKSNTESKSFFSGVKEASKLRFGEGLPGKVAKTQTPIFWSIGQRNEDFIREKAAIEIGIKNIVVLPIYQNKQTIGVWLLGTKNKRIDEVTIQRLWEEINPFLSGEIVRKQVEDELTRLVELAPDIICMLDGTGNFKRINATGCYLLEYSEDEILNENFKKFVHPEDQVTFKNHIDLLLKEKTTSQVQSRFVTKSNQVIWLDWTSAVTADEEFIYAVAKNSTEKKKLQTLLDDATKMARIGSWELDVNKKSLYWSDMTREIHEAPADFSPVLEEGINFYKKEYQPIVKRTVNEAIKKGKSWDFEMPIITMKVNECWVRTMGQADFKDGKCVKLYGNFQDIHKRKVAELNLTKTLSEKNEILERIGDAFFAVDKNWIVTYWNSIAEKVLHTPKEVILGKNLWDVFSDAVNLPSYKFYHKAMRTGKAIHFEDFYAPVNSWFEISVYPSETGLSVYFVDVSDRKLAEEEIKQSNERFEKVAQATNDAIWDWNILDDTQYRGEGFKTLFGHDITTIDPREFSWSEHLHPEDKEEAEHNIEAAILDKNRVNWSHEYRYRKSNGEYTFVIDRGVIIRNANGKAIRMVGAMTDVTEKLAHIKAIEDQNKLLKQIAWEQSHLFRAPLSRLMGIVDLIDNGKLQVSEKEDLLTDVIESANEMDTIVKDISEKTNDN